VSPTLTVWPQAVIGTTPACRSVAPINPATTARALTIGAPLQPGRRHPEFGRDNGAASYPDTLPPSTKSGKPPRNDQRRRRKVCREGFALRGTPCAFSHPRRTLAPPSRDEVSGRD